MHLDGAGAGLEDPGRAQSAGAGLSMDVWQGEKLLAAQQELTVSSLVDLSAPGESACARCAPILCRMVARNAACVCMKNQEQPQEVTCTADRNVRLVNQLPSSAASSSTGSWEMLRQGWDGYIGVFAGAEVDKAPFPLVRQWNRLATRLKCALLLSCLYS
jgi:hypothetical protein